MDTRWWPARERMNQDGSSFLALSICNITRAAHDGPPGVPLT